MGGCTLLLVPAALALLATAAPARPVGPSVDGPGCVLDCAIDPAFDRWQPAERLRYGYGMTGRDRLAVKWYRRSAEAGDPRAMHNFGLMLSRGQGIAPDPRSGRAWLVRAMARGVSESAFALGQMARTGQGGPADPARARAYLDFAAGRGHVRAMHALGNLHAAGLGGPRSLERAYVWYLLAAEMGHELAAAARDAAAARLPDRVRRRAEAEARAWRRSRRD